MKRSEVNDIIRQGDAFIRSFGYVLPPFAYWSPQQLLDNTRGGSGILRGNLGWDITDFGSGRFGELGLFLFTVRNGVPEDLAHGRGMVYAEKIMIAKRGQVTPMHRHNIKSEDIINRGGGKLVLELFMARPDGSIDEEAEVQVTCDGSPRTLKPGSLLKLEPGESVTLHTNVWHAFWGEGEDVLIGEVSTVNDDRTDNVFRDPIGRFASIDEDVQPSHLLVSDYDSWLKA